VFVLHSRTPLCDVLTANASSHRIRPVVCCCLGRLRIIARNRPVIHGCYGRLVIIAACFSVYIRVRYVTDVCECDCICALRSVCVAHVWMYFGGHVLMFTPVCCLSRQCSMGSSPNAAVRPLSMLKTSMSAIHARYTMDALPVPRHFVGAMSVVCPHCSARFFPGENLHCCANGAVELPLWRAPPEPLLSLLKEDTFRTKLRGYNCALSLGSSVFDDLTAIGGPATFKMAGRSWHLLPSSSRPTEVGSDKTAQIYALPVDEATDRRVGLSSAAKRPPLRRDWLSSLHAMLLQHNALVRSFTQSCDDGRDWHVDIGALEPHATATNDTMIGLLINGGAQRCSTVVPIIGGPSLIVVQDTDPYYQPLHFVLLFPFGEPQWGLHLNRVRSDGRKRKREFQNISILDYLKFHLQRRCPGSVSIHDFGRLFEEWVVDCFLQSENQTLRFLKFNQGKFRREQFVSLHRQLHAAVPPRQIGSPATHLPSSFVRGARYYRELYADAMTLPAHYGGIDYFLTFTTNPSWPEITDNASIGSGMNSPDLYCRVFYAKMKALLTDILQHGVLGVVVAYAWAVEFQQRGLPHLHACFIMRPEDKPHSIEVQTHTHTNSLTLTLSLSLLAGCRQCRVCSTSGCYSRLTVFFGSYQTHDTWAMRYPQPISLLHEGWNLSFRLPETLAESNDDTSRRLY